jgi:hypothetical protein
LLCLALHVQLKFIFQLPEVCSRQYQRRNGNRDMLLSWCLCLGSERERFVALGGVSWMPFFQWNLVVQNRYLFNMMKLSELVQVIVFLTRVQEVPGSNLVWDPTIFSCFSWFSTFPSAR